MTYEITYDREMLGCTFSSHIYLRGPIMLLKKSGSHYTFSTISHIISLRRQGWDKSGDESVQPIMSQSDYYES
jgi:hypothetical protein